MAISWGSWVSNPGTSTGRQRVGLEPSRSGNTITVRYYRQTLYQISQTFNPGLTRTASPGVSFSPGSVGSITWSYTSENQSPAQLFHTATFTGSPGQTYTLGASMPLFGTRTATVSGVSIAVPVLPPSAPTSATVTRNSDTRQDVSWVRPGNASTAETRWDNAVVQRSVDGGSYGTVATLSGTSTSWSDTATSANHTYRYRVAGKNASGTSAYAYTAYIDTTPAAPTNVVAKKSGSDITITWTDNSPYNTDWQVRDNGTLIATIPYLPNSYTHLSPNPSVTHQYTVRAVTDAPVLYSAYGTSNTVQLLTAPNAPTGLSPNGVARDVALATVLTWTHNPVDTTGQTAYAVEHRLVGGSTWTTASVTSGTSQHTLAQGTYPSGSSVEWRVRTKGDHSSYSPYSAVATFSLSTVPAASLVYPDGSGAHDEPSIEVEWSYYQADSHPQSGWEVQILQGGLVIASGTGTNSATRTWTSPTVLQGEQSYDVRVRVRESSGFWSPWDTQTILVQFDPPAESIATAAWQDGYGNVLITAQAVSEAGLPETVSHDIERSVDGGNTWAVIATDLPADPSFIDWESPASGTFHYRVTAVSALPSTAATVVEVTVPDTDRNCVVWVGGGPGFAQVVKLASNPVISYDGGRERVLHSFAGRSVPVEHSSMRAPKTIGVSATFMSDTDVTSSSRAEVEDLFDLPGPHLYRDPLGRVLYGTLSGLSWVREPGGGYGGVSFSITRSAPPDAAQAASMSGWYAPRIAEVAPGVYRVINADVAEASPGVFEEIG